MRLLTKLTLLFLSILSVASCSSEKSNLETPISNEIIIDSIIKLSSSWNDSIAIELKNIGKELNDPFTFQNIGNAYYPNSILIYCSEEENIELIRKSSLIEKMNCATDGGFLVCHEQSIKGFKLRYSIRPHPTLKWIFRIERVF